jgi:hypothetical protein
MPFPWRASDFKARFVQEVYYFNRFAIQDVKSLAAKVEPPNLDTRNQAS